MRNRLKEFPIGCKSDDGRLYDPVTATVIAVGMIGGSMYSANEQRKATRDASNAQQRAAMDARRIAAEQKPMEEKATLGIDTGGQTSALGSLGLLIEPDKAKRPTGLNVSGKSGLGASTTSGLGFGS